MNAYKVGLVKTRSMQKFKDQDGHPTEYTDENKETEIMSKGWFKKKNGIFP